ncbi:hypothetical protein PRVXH_002159 [Proteinivorax hydrogeniformans]|uniref:Leucine-rich repeat domain-containing protein n=1 Tax=Proteinivorax hydrogeniformans TaxID=1826727 RepID=A0AAU8HRM3_9FIRM
MEIMANIIYSIIIIAMLCTIMSTIYFGLHKGKLTERYYTREKIFNLIAIVITMVSIFNGWELILSVFQIIFLLIVRAVYLRYQGKLQTGVMGALLLFGSLFEYNYFVIHYFEYIMLAFFVGFFIYNVYVSAPKTRTRDVSIALVGVLIFLSLNLYMTNNRELADPQLQKTVNSQLASLKESHPTIFHEIDDITILSLGRDRFRIKTLEGIEKLQSLQLLTIYQEDRLMDYSQLAELKNLESLTIFNPHPDFSINDLPDMKNLKHLSVGAFDLPTDENIIVPDLPNLENLEIFSHDIVEPTSLDIRQIPEVEVLRVIVNINEIIGLEEAKHLEKIYVRPFCDYADEIKELRPDIEVRGDMKGGG